MTESEWLSCGAPRLMLEFVQGKVSDRKLRLFAVAYCRSIWLSLKSIRSRRSVEIAENYADSLTSRKKMIEAGRAANGAIRSAFASRSLPEWMSVAADYNAARNCAFANAWESAYYASGSPNIAAHIDTPLAVRLAGFLRETLGNPFRTVSINPAWLTPTVTRLATAAYEERILPPGELDTARLAVLADALEEAGCDNADILNHLRGPGPHVRGCWVVDLLLGKS